MEAESGLFKIQFLKNGYYLELNSISRPHIFPSLNELFNFLNQLAS
jgi:hypothetical protein